MATTVPLVAPLGVGQAAAPVGQGFELNASDLRFILKQIKIAEHHVANTTAGTGPCGALIGPGENQIPEGGVGVTLPWGLRTVDGSCNNIVSGQSEFGTADNTFPRIAPAEYRPGYAPTGPNVPPIQDSGPRMISNLIVDQSLNNPAAIEAAGGDEAAAAGADADGNLFIPNVAPDTGLSAPYNSWFTLFGQFFDHGLDLVNKGGAGVVQINLPPGDPLTAEVVATPPFVPAMFLTRATHVNGEANNQTSSWVDQSQTYASHPSHQVFLREYELVAGKPVATGRLIEGANGGMATWARVKEQARLVLGIELTDVNVTDVPLLLTDPYGNFIPDTNGFPQIVLADNTLRPGSLPVDPLDPLSPAASLAGAAKTGHAFLDDIAHHAAPKSLAPDADTLADPSAGPDPTSPFEDDFLSGTYDDEMLDAHFIAGDGRVNENIGLTAVHHVFHSEHNRLVEEIDGMLHDPAQGFTEAEILEWETLNPASRFDYAERLFQAARFVTEMQYQHLAFEEFARKVQPMVNLFGEGGTGYHTDIDPRITAEFAHAVYRFGHSMLTETVDRTTANGANDPIPLLDAFLNPPAFFENTPDPDAAAGEIVLGMTRQVGNELDEFVTEALRNDLVGLPLDLAALNIARGRETGIPSLNSFRRTVFAITGDSGLAPYSSWLDLGYSLRHGEKSLINFVAAYGAHPTVTAQQTATGKRAAATALFALAASAAPVAPTAPGVAPTAPTAPIAPIDPGPEATVDEQALYADALAAYNAALEQYDLDLAQYTLDLAAYNAAVDAYNGDLAAFDQLVAARQDAIDFLDSTGPWSSNAQGVTTTGVDAIDLWMGGLAERQQVFGGLLGSTFNYVFERQMENLQDGDRFYYLSRTAGLNLLTQLEGNSFAELTMRNTSAQGLPADSFSRPAFIFDLAAQNASGPIVDDPATDYPENGPGMLVREPNGTIRYTGVEHVVFNGTIGKDKARASEGDDTFRGNEDNDVYEGGDGNDAIVGGDGDDILTDLFGDDVIKGGPGNDTISSGRGFGGDLNQGGTGSDFIIGGNDMTESFAGAGNDFVYAGDAEDTVFGDEGNDWIEGGKGPFALLQGDSGAPFQDDPNEPGHDVIFGWGGEQDYDAEGGDDIMFAGPGIQRAEGMQGFDWVTHRSDPVPGNSDMSFSALLPPAVDVNRDRFDLVEALSGWQYADVLRGDDGDAGTMTGHELTAAGIARILGLAELVGSDGFTGGNIILGGAGSDLIEGRGGDDVIDGDRWLDAQLRAPNVATADPADTKLVDNLPALRADVLAGRINPGQIVIERAIKTATDGAIDTALFQGAMDEYDVTGDIDSGIITVAHVGGLANEGTDTLHNIERLQFADGEILRGQLINRPAGGTVTVNGTPLEDQTLTAVANVTDPEGVDLSTLVIEWQIDVAGEFDLFPNWQSIGVQGNTLQLNDAQVGFPVRAVATFLDTFGVNEQVESLGTAPVQNVNDAPVGQAVLSTLAPEATVPMSVDVSSIADDDGLPVTLTIEWFADGTPVGSGASFTPGLALAGTSLQVVVSWTDGHGTDESVTSATTDPVVIPALPNLELSTSTIDFGTRAIGSTPPLGTVTVTNTGTAPLLVSAATVSGVGAASYAPTNGCTDPLAPGLSCAIGVTLLTTGPVGTAAATLTITSNDPGGAAPVALVAIQSNNVAPTGAPTVNDVTPIETQALTASPTSIADANGLTTSTFSFRWQQSGLGGGGNFTDIAGATGPQLVLGQDQVNRRLRVVATFTDDHGTVEQSTSAATGLVGDVFVGTIANEIFTGTSVTDIALGGGGADSLSGNAGDDTLAGGTGNDTVNGDGGNDTIRFGVGDGFDIVSGGGGGDVVVAMANNTVIGLRAIAGVEQISSGGFTGVTISGTTGVETLNFGGVTLVGIVSINGGGGNDNLSGSAAADDLRGGTGNDTLNGNGGNDTIRGGGGTDTITPGAGNDVVVLEIGDGTNTVNGFDTNPTGGQDRLDVRALGVTAANFNATVIRTQVGGNTRITIGSVVIILSGVNVGTVSVTDFVV